LLNADWLRTWITFHPNTHTFIFCLFNQWGGIMRSWLVKYIPPYKSNPQLVHQQIGSMGLRESWPPPHILNLKGNLGGEWIWIWDVMQSSEPVYSIRIYNTKLTSDCWKCSNFYSLANYLHCTKALVKLGRQSQGGWGCILPGFITSS